MQEIVERLCRQLDITPDDLAARLGVHKRLVLNWLTGRVREAPQSLLLQNALRALEEGFGRDFVFQFILTNEPVSYRAMAESLGGSRDSERAASKPQSDVLSDMELASDEALENGHYIQSALILFQAIETLVRILIRTRGQSRLVPDEVLRDAADKEQSFLRLTLHLNLVYPDNPYSEDLKRLNRRRNDTMHRLFYEFESRSEMEATLKTFCEEARDLRDQLAEEVRRYVVDSEATAPESIEG